MGYRGYEAVKLRYRQQRSRQTCSTPSETRETSALEARDEELSDQELIRLPATKGMRICAVLLCLVFLCLSLKGIIAGLLLAVRSWPNLY